MVFPIGNWRAKIQFPLNLLYSLAHKYSWVWYESTSCPPSYGLINRTCINKLLSSPQIILQNFSPLMCLRPYHVEMPVHVRSPNLSNVKSGCYLEGWSLGDNRWCVLGWVGFNVRSSSLYWHMRIAWEWYVAISFPSAMG